MRTDAQNAFSHGESPTHSGTRLIGIMNSRNNQAPFSLPEFAAASIAMAVVAVITFRGILGSRESNLSAASLSRPRATSTGERSLQVGQWRLDSSDLNTRARPNRMSDVVAVRKTETSVSAREAGNPTSPNPGRANESRASTFFAEASPATIVEMRLSDIGGPPAPLIGTSDLFRMKNAITANVAGARPARPIKEATIPPYPERRESR